MEFKRSLLIEKCVCCHGPVKHVEFDPEGLDPTDDSETLDGYECTSCGTVMNNDGTGVARIAEFEVSYSGDGRVKPRVNWNK